MLDSGTDYYHQLPGRLLRSRGCDVDEKPLRSWGKSLGLIFDIRH